MAKPKYLSFKKLAKKDLVHLKNFEVASMYVKECRAELNEAEADKRKLVPGVVNIFERRSAYDGIRTDDGLVSIVWDPQRPPSVAQVLDYIAENGGKKTAFYRKLKRLAKKLTTTLGSQVRYRLEDNGEGDDE